MPTVIDSLVIVLGLDTKQFNQAQKDAIAQLQKTENEAKRAAKDTEEAARRSRESFSGATKQLLGYAAAFVSLRGIQRYIHDITVANAETGRTANVLATSTKELSIWRGAVERVGGTADGFTASVGGLVQQFQQFALTGESSVIPWFRALQVDIADTVGRMRPFRDIMLDLSERFSKMRPEQAATFGRALGLDQHTINLLLLGRDALKALLDEQERINQVSQADADSSAALQKSWTGLAQAATSLGRAVVNFLTPALIGLADGWAKMLREFRQGTFIAPGSILDRFMGGSLQGSAAQPGLDGRGNVGSKGGGAGGRGAISSALRVKPGSGTTSAATQSLAEALQGDIPGLNRFTAFNDPSHAGRPSAHNQGRALDFTLNDPAQSAAVARQVRAKLAEMGISATVIDEYARPSPFSTGGHIHVQFNSAADAQRYAGARGAVGEALRQAPGSALQPAGVASAAGGAAPVGNQSSSAVTIGSITVQTQATDANGIARDLRGAIERNSFATQANTAD